MSFLFGLATSRTDSAQLMEPYEDSLMVLLDQDSREPAIYLLGIEHPRPSPRALTALYAHLNDGKNSPEEFDLIAGALLSSFPADPSVAHEVLAAARKRMKVGVDDSIIRNIGLAKITNAEALAYVREGFSDPGVRIAAVEAIGRMPSEIRARFVNELRSVAEDSGERPETRAEAQQVLKEP
jgi:hypothetical protein